jgi:hypothetical protein
MSSAPTSPVIVISPAVRAGTTLVQRLLCSAPNTLIYGDLTGQEMDFLAKYVYSRQQMLAHHESLAGPQREVVRAGGTDEFLTALTPSPTMQHRQWRDAALAWLRGCEEDAAAQGRSVWGWKLAGVDGFALSTLAAWLPEARWIWVRRKIEDCFRSAKAAHMAEGTEGARQFFLQAEHSTRMWQAAGMKHRLELDYHAMLADPAGTVQRLEAFTGASGIDPAVFGRKINDIGARWNPPASLTPEENAIFNPAIAASA